MRCKALAATAYLAAGFCAATNPVVAAAADGQSPPAALAAPVVVPALIPDAVQFDITSKVTGLTYRIYVAKPLDREPAGGYPVLYTLDAGATFATAASQAGLGKGEGRSALLVVGVGYRNGGPNANPRNLDFTPSDPTGRSKVWMEQAYGPMKPGQYGGAAKFHRFMMEELRPLIGAMYRVDAQNQSLMGYSLGGLFTLHVLFNHPESYRNYVAGSPSIWWNDSEVLQAEPQFAAAVRARQTAPRVLITSGEWEQSDKSPALARTEPKRSAEIKDMQEGAMVDNARNLAARLKAVPGAAPYEVRYALFAEETHLTGFAASTSRAVAFVSTP